MPLNGWQRTNEGLTASDCSVCSFASRDKPWKKWRSVPQEPGIFLFLTLVRLMKPSNDLDQQFVDSCLGARV
jgi:hypothetical protein